MDKDLIENHKKNLESLEKLKLKTTDTEDEIKLKKLKKMRLVNNTSTNNNTNNNNINNFLFYIKNSYKILYLPTKYIYLFTLSLVLFFLVYEKNIPFKKVYYTVENKKIL